MMKTALPLMVSLLPLLMMWTLSLAGGSAGGGTAPSSDDQPPELPGAPAIRCQTAPEEDEGAITSLSFSPDGKALAAGNTKGVARWFDPATARQLASSRVMGRLQGGCDALAYTPDGKSLAAPTGLDEVSILDAASGRPRLALEKPTFSTHLGWAALAIAADGKMVAGGYGSGEIVLWDAATGRQRAVLPAYIVPGHASGPLRKITPALPAGITALAFTPDGSALVSAGGVVRVWDVAAGDERLRLEKPAHSSCSRLAVSPDGSILAVGGQAVEPGVTASTISLWDRSTGRKRAELPTRAAVSGLAFLPGGRTLVSLDADQVVRLWDIDGARQRAALRFERHCRLDRLAVSPDGKLIAAGGFESDPRFGIIQLIQTDGATLGPWQPRP